MIVNTNNGPVELSEKAFEINIEIFDLKNFIRGQAARLAQMTDFDEIEELAGAIKENVWALWRLEKDLEEENAK